jgi:hypothetical protein
MPTSGPAGFEIPPSLIPYLLHEKIDDSTLQPLILKVNIVYIVVIIIATSLRFTVRFRMLRSAGLDDRELFLVLILRATSYSGSHFTVLMVFALLFALLLSISTLIGENYGLGKHIWNLNGDLLDLAYDVGRVTKALYGCYLAYSTSITLTKLSIIATYTRIFPNGPLRYSFYAIGVVVIIFWITSIFCIIFTCVPVQAAWDYTITDAKCIHILDYFYTSAGVNIATDLLLCFLPLPTIWKLQMPKAQRVVVCFIFLMGTLYMILAPFFLLSSLQFFSACVATVLRLIQLVHLNAVDVTC